LAAAVAGTTVTLHWTAPAGAVTSYVIEAGSFPGTNDLAIFDTGSAATVVIVVNVPARIYWVRVRARNGAEVGDASNEIAVTVAGGNCTATLYAPAAWRASGAGSSVSLAWDPPIIGCPPSDYIVEAGSTRNGVDLANFRTGSPALGYNATGVGAGTYYVRVRAANDFGVSYPTTEKVMVFGAGCFYAVGPSTLFISRGASPVSVQIETGPACPWTITADAAWLLTAIGVVLPTSGTGPASVLIAASINTGPVRIGTVQVRWSGGGADIPVMQNGF
jgi:hypothetical protein